MLFTNLPKLAHCHGSQENLKIRFNDIDVWNCLDLNMPIQTILLSVCLHSYMQSTAIEGP